MAAMSTDRSRPRALFVAWPRSFRSVGALALAALSAGCTRSSPPSVTRRAAAAPDLGEREVCASRPPAWVVAKAAARKRAESVCPGAVAALAEGREVAPSPSLPLDAPEVKRALAETARAFASCRAVAADDDAPCARLAGDKERAFCRDRRARFHAARASSSAPLVLGDEALARCKKAVPGSACDALRDALRAGNPSLCPASGPVADDCPALAAADPARCKSEDCRRLADFSRLVRAGGLARVAESGAPDDRPLAAAALGRPGACAPLLAPVEGACKEAIEAQATPDGGA